jgi:hypothetical protein
MSLDSLIASLKELSKGFQELEANSAGLRIDASLGEALPGGYQVRITGATGRGTKERFDALATRAGATIRAWTAPGLEHLPPDLTDRDYFLWAIVALAPALYKLSPVHFWNPDTRQELVAGSIDEPVAGALVALDSMIANAERQKLQSPDDLMVLSEAASLIGVSERTIKRWIESSGLRGFDGRVSRAELQEKEPLLRQRRSGGKSKTSKKSASAPKAAEKKPLTVRTQGGHKADIRASKRT